MNNEDTELFENNDKIDDFKIINPKESSIIMLLDTPPSMRGKKLGEAITAAKRFTDLKREKGCIT